MAGGTPTNRRSLLERVGRCLDQCAEWSQAGRHHQVLAAVERILPVTRGEPDLEAGLLVWKAQALLSMGQAERAVAAATRSWELEPTPHAYHLMALGLHAQGDVEESERLLRSGFELFPNAVHLPVQLAVLQADQGRLPEALDTLSQLPTSTTLPEGLDVFLFGLRANLLAAVGRWSEAREALSEGLRQYPNDALLRETKGSVDTVWKRVRAEEDLAASWRGSLRALDGIEAEVDDAIVEGGVVLELSELTVLAARRLWREFCRAGPARPVAPESWGAGVILASLELDGDKRPATGVARALAVKVDTVRSAHRKVRSFLAGLEPELARRSFAAHRNPRLQRPPGKTRTTRGWGEVVRFPSAKEE